MKYRGYCKPVKLFCIIVLLWIHNSVRLSNPVEFYCSTKSESYCIWSKRIYHIKYLPPAIFYGLVSGVTIQVVSLAENVGHIWDSTVSPSAIQLTKAYGFYSVSRPLRAKFFSSSSLNPLKSGLEYLFHWSEDPCSFSMWSLIWTQ